MKILVTGATGFVGPRIVHALRAENRDVRALVRRPERATHLTALGVELATGDVTDPASLAAAVDGCTHVVHLVAIIKGSRGRLRARDDAGDAERRSRPRRTPAWSGSC